MNLKSCILCCSLLRFFLLQLHGICISNFQIIHKTFLWLNIKNITGFKLHSLGSQHATMANHITPQLGNESFMYPRALNVMAKKHALFLTK